MDDQNITLTELKYRWTKPLLDEIERLQAEVEELTEKAFTHSSAAMENLKEVELLNNLLDLNTQRCEALRGQLRDSNESYEKHLNEIESQVPRWIPVTERLPDFHEEVLIYAIGKEDGFSPVVAISEIYIFRLLPFSNGTIEWRDPWDFFSKNYEVTHWMPLPDAPEVER